MLEEVDRVTRVCTKLVLEHQLLPCNHIQVTQDGDVVQATWMRPFRPRSQADKLYMNSNPN